MPNVNNADEIDVSFDFEITRVAGRDGDGGRWVFGRLSGHRFQALVFGDHAESKNYELDGSRISKLWLQRLADKTEVANFDRGWDLKPTSTEASVIVDFLAAGLADYIFWN